MEIKKLTKNEAKTVAGGALPTQFVSLDSSFQELATSSGSIKSPIGSVAIACCNCHCCGTHSGLQDIGNLANTLKF